MKRIILSIAVFFISISTYSNGVNENAKRAEELRKEMWENSGDNFKVVDIPAKWKDESAVIIAKDNRLGYRKEAIVSNLNYNRYNHWRIKLLSSSAIEKYSEFSITGSGSYRNTKFAFYAGFKVIKASGEEILISLDQMVKENAQLNNYRLDIFKLAIPNLEVGDILDYYIAEERTISLYSSKYYSFDPVIFELNDSYPIMKQRIMFDVLRRCFINLKSLNGAPDFKVVQDGKDDRSNYILEDSDRERVDDMLWLHNYRAIPTIKFKVTYASSGAASAPTFIGNPGVLKSKVTKNELTKFLSYLFGSGYYRASALEAFMKKKHKNVKDKAKLAELAFYALRHRIHVKNAEISVLKNNGYTNSPFGYKFVKQLSAYYKYKKIKHEVLVGIPRYISDLDDLILENELSYAIKVTESTEPIYISYFDAYAYYGELDTDLQGVTVYSANGLISPKSWTLKKVSLPVESMEENKTTTSFNYSIDNLQEGLLTLTAAEDIKGAGQDYYQRYLTDFFTFKPEEDKMYPPENEYSGVSKKQKAKYAKIKEEMLGSRKEDFEKTMKLILESDLEVEIDEVSDFKVEQSGRFHDKSSFIYSYKAKIKGPLKKVGPNYLLDIGKLMDDQIQIDEDDKNRKFNVYMPFARSFSYNITLAIPEGYEVQGLEKLNLDVSNVTGGFNASTEMDGDKLVLKVNKFYNSNYEPNENWSLMLDFLTAADGFNDTQILLKKKG